MTMKLRMHREPVYEVEGDVGDSLRFPVRAVRAMPAPHHGVGTKESRVSDPNGTMRHPELIRQIEATLDRMQAGIDQLSEHVENVYKFPGVEDSERPRAA